MSVVTLTDAQVDELLGMPKRVQNPSAREREDGKHLRRNYQVISDDKRHEFVLFTRQSTIIKNGFSAGLRWRSKAGEEVILLRCNGSDHAHVNAIERDRFESEFHIHRATERYILAGKRSEGHAEPTAAFQTIGGALHEVMRIAHISGLIREPDEKDLFD